MKTLIANGSIDSEMQLFYIAFSMNAVKTITGKLPIKNAILVQIYYSKNAL